MLTKQLKNIPSKDGSQIITFSRIALFLVLSVVVLYCSLPVVLNDYTWLPGDDYQEYLGHLRNFPEPIRYYGTLPAKLLPFDNSTSLRIYYYLTPLLVFAGLYTYLKNYNLWTVIFAFMVLFFMTPVVLQDMDAGTFVGIVGFYTVFLPSLYLFCKYNLSKKSSTLLLLFSALFHTTTGTFLMLGYILSKVRRPSDLLPLLPAVGVAVVWGIFFQGSTAQVTQAHNYTYTPPMEHFLFLKQYLGVTTFALQGLVFLFCYNTSKLYGFKDKFVVMLFLLTASFLFLAFFPHFHLNSDRLSKFAVGLLVIAFTVAFGRAYNKTVSENPKARKFIDLGIVSIFSLLLYNTFYNQFDFWLGMGM